MAQLQREIDTITIHSADWPNGKHLSVGEIDRWHLERRFRRQVYWVRRFNTDLHAFGYHYLIDVDGQIYTGRHLDEIPAQAKGHNSKSVGICLAGRNKFTPAQWASLALLVERIRADIKAGKHPLVPTVNGHRDLSPDKNGDGIISPNEWAKTCPGFNVADWLKGGMEPLAGHIIDQPKGA